MLSSADTLLTASDSSSIRLKLKVILQYVIAAGLSLVIFTLITHAWHLKLTVPFFYSWDSIFSSLLIKSVIDTGWYTVNPYIGAPNGFNLGDFPLNADNFHFLIIKILSHITNNYAVIFNTFYILTFPATTLVALFVLKRLRLNYPFALAASLLFAFTPYHFFRGESGHLFLASYFIVPLIVWLCVLIASHRITSFPRRKLYTWGIYCLLCVLIGSSGIYYTFFGIFFIFMSGLLTSLREKTSSPLLQAILLCFLITTAVTMNLLPSINYRLHYGTNQEVAARAPFESELYGLKIIQMLLPLDNDRLPILEKLKTKYNNSAMLINKENGVTTLGVIGGIGFLLLLGVSILSLKQAKEIDIISKLNMCGTLLATVGGFGSLLAYTFSPIIRCYSRISIFIAFFSLYAFFFFLQKLLKRNSISHNRLFIGSLAILLLAIGIFNQTGKSFADLQNQSLLANYNNDRDFIFTIEKMMDSDDMVYQLPYMAFPEHAPIFSMADYEHLRAYLHSHSLKWSYGAMKGRPIAEWQDKISHLSPQEMINNLAYMGYSGIYIDRNGYSDHGGNIEQQVSSILHSSPVVSKDDNLSFFDMRPYVTKLQKSQSTSTWHHQRMQTLVPSQLTFDWQNGFYGLENDHHQQWRWSNKKSVLNIVNYDTKPIQVKINFKIFTAASDFSILTLRSSSGSDRIKINNAGTLLSRTLKVLPGINKISFSSDAPQVAAPGDPRQLYFGIQNFTSEVLSRN